MKLRSNRRARISILQLVLVALWQITQPLKAATFYWDTDGTDVGNATTGAGLGGTGTWDIITSNWWPVPAGALTTWGNTSADIAIFSAPFPTMGIPLASTVTLTSGITANQLRFERSGYTLTGGDLTLAGTTPTLHANLGESATINSLIQGSGGLTKIGGGAIRLGNASNSYTGTTTISNGSLIISSQGALGADTSAIVVTGFNPVPTSTNVRGFGGGSLVLDGTSAGFTLTRDLSLQGQGPIADRSAALINIGNNTLSGTVTTGEPFSGTNLNTRLTSALGTLTLSGTLNVQGTAATTITTLGGTNQAGAAAYDLTAVLSGTGTVEKSGGGTLFLNPSTTAGFSGTLRVSGSVASGQSTVRITSANVLGTRTATTTSSVLEMNGGLVEVRMDTPSILAGGAPANVYGNDSSTIFVDHSLGSTAVNGTATFGQFAFDDDETMTLTSRNGYSMTFGAAPVQGGGNANSVFTNNLGGALTFTGAFWSNTENTAARTMTIGGNGNTLISGNLTASAAAFDHILTKSGSGSLTISSTGSTLDGTVNIQAGAIRITDFRSITNNTSLIRLGNTTTTGGNLIIGGTGVTPTAAGLTTSKAIELNTTTGSNSIYANQTGANPVILNGAITKIATATTGNLILGGTNTADNIINSAIPVEPTPSTGGVQKVGSGTWVLAGSNTYLGATTLSNGILKLKANAASSTILADTSGITFNAINVFAGASLEFVGQDGVSNVENLGALTPTQGANTIKLSPGAGGTASLVFASLGTVGGGGTVNIDTPSSSNTISFTTIATTNNIANAGLYYNGADFAFVPGAGLALRAPVYGTDADFATSATALTAGQSNEITGSFATGGALAIDSLKINGSQTLTLGGNLTIRTAAGATASGGIIQTGGSGTITGAFSVGTNNSAATVIRVNGPADTLTLESTLFGTGGFTKGGEGTLILAGVNAQTGTVSINEGTVQLSGSGQLGAAGAALTMRQDTTLDLNGITPATATGAFNNNGTVTNSSATAATFTVGGSNGTGTSLGIIDETNGMISLTKVGTGAQGWLGNNTYTGVTTIGSTGLVTVNTLADGGVASGIGASTSAAANLVFNGSTGGLVYQGSIVDGNLTLGSRSASTDRLFTLAGTGATLSSTASNGNAIVWSNTGAIVHGIVGPQTLIFTGTSTGDNTFNPQLSDSGVGANITSVTKQGAGQWNLGNAGNNYTGLTTVENGILALNANGAVPANSPVVLTPTSATSAAILQMSGAFERNLSATPTAGTGSITWGFSIASTTGGAGFAAHTTPLTVAIGGIASPTALTWGSGGFVGTGGVQNLVLGSTTALSSVDFRNAIDLGALQRTINVLDNTGTGADFAIISGVLSGVGGGIQKIGAGILRLTGSNTYTGVTDISTGTLVVSSLGNSASPGATSVGDSTAGNTNAGAITLGNAGTGGAILQYVGAGETSDRKIRFNSTTGGPQIHADGSGALILTNVANDMGLGAKTLSLRGSNTAGNMITSQLSDNGGALAVTVDGGATWILTNSANNYTGTTSINAGALGVGSDTALGTSLISFNSGNMFAYGADRTLTNSLDQDTNTTMGFLGDYSLTFTGVLASLASTTNVGTNNNLAAGKTLTFGGVTANSLSTANRTWTIDGSGETIINGDITTSTALGLNLTKTGNGTLVLNGTASNYNQNNANTDLDRGTLRLGANEVIPHAAGGGGLTLSPELATGDTATLDLNGKAETVNALTATTDGAVVIDNTSATAASLTFGANDSTVNFGGGTGTYTITDSGAGALSIFKTGNTATTIPSNVTLTYQGTTGVTGGSMTIAAPVNGTTGLSVTNSGSVLTLSGGITTPGAITSVVVENGATLSLLDGAGNKLSGLTSLQLGSSGGALTTLNLNVGDVSVAGDELNTDLLTLLTGGTLSLFAGNQIRFNLTDAGLNPSQTYELLNFVDGGFTSGPLANTDYLLGATPGGFSSITLTATNTSVFITTGTLITGTSYWRGLTDTTWNGNVNNWSQDKAGTTPALSIPGQGTDVVFQWDAPTNAAVVTTLEQNFKINSLTFEASTTPANTPTSVTINPGTLSTNRIEIAPQVSTDGIKITTGGPPSVIIGTAVRLGANQTWEVADAASTLSLGSLRGEADVTKSGAGKVTLTAAADATFNAGVTADIAVTAGTLEITDSGALGNTINGNLANVSVGSGAAFYYNGAAGTVANPLALSGGALSAGTANQIYSGTVGISADSFINMRDSNSATLTTTARNITLSGVLSGTGKLAVDSINTLSGGNQFTGTLTLSNNNSSWSGGIDLMRGTVTATNVDALGTGNISGLGGGRIIFNTAGGTTFNLAQNITLDAPGGILELSADASGTPVSDMTVNLSGVITIGSATNANNALRVSQASDNFSIINITNSIVLGNDASISYQGSSVRVLDITAVISETGGSRALAINDELGGWGVTSRTVRLGAANTFSGNLLLNEGALEFSTVSNIGGPASNLGQGSAITLGGATLSFIGGSSQSTDRPITQTGASIYSANGTGGASITYNGAISAGTSAFTLTGTTGSTGIIAGGLTQTDDAADGTINGATWRHQTGASRVGDDLTLTGASTIFHLDSGLFQVRDDFTVTAGATLNLNGAGVLSFNTATLSGDATLQVADGGVINLNANDAVVVTEFDRLFVGQSAGGATAILNMNSFNLSTNRLILGERAADREGVINGTGLLTVLGGDIDLYEGTINAPLASTGAGTFEKFGPDTVTLTANNSGLGSTGASIVNEGTLVLDFTTDNNTKLRAASQLSMVGGNLVISGNASAATSQTVGSFTLGSGGSSRITINPGAGQEAVLNLGAITRANGSQDGTIRFVLPGGVQSATNGFTTTTGLTNGLVGSSGFATVDDGAGVWFATKSGNNIVALASTPKNDVTTWALGDHITDETTGFTGALQCVSINSLRFDAAGGSDVSIASTGVLSIASGGILVTSNVGGTPSIMGGALASGTAELIITHDSTQAFEISSRIGVNHAVTKSGTGTLRLSGNNFYTDETEIQEGALQVSGGNAIGDTSLVTLAVNRDSTLQLLADETIGRLAGGQRNTNSEHGLVDIGSNTLTINQSANTTYAGFFTGTGGIVLNGPGNLNMSNASSGFTGTVTINSGLFQLSNVGQNNASDFTINKGGNLLIDNNGTTRSGARILDGASITLNSADGAFNTQTRPRGLAIRTDQDTTLDETVGVVTVASGANYAALEATTTNDDSDIIMSNLVRINSATLNVRGTNLGSASAQRNEFRITAANEAAFVATLVGGGGAAGTQNISIVPWAIGETFTGALADANMGNSLVTYVAGPGIRPLDFATEYDSLALAAATDNARESLTADLTGLAGTTVNALVLHNNNVAASTINVTGTGAGQTLAVTSGALLFTLSPAAVAGAYGINLGGFDNGITVGGTNEFVIHVINPSSAAGTATLTATVASPLTSNADITKSGRGDLVLTALNTAGGGANKTTINEGTLEVSDLDNIGGTTGGLVFAGGVLLLSATYSGDDLSTRSISFLMGGGTIDTNGSNLALAGSLGAGVGGFTKAGLGTLTLNAAATYTGSTTVAAGTVIVGANNAIGSGSLAVAGGATLDIGANSVSVGLVTTSGASPIISGTGTITSPIGFFFNHTGDTTIDAVLAGSGGIFKAQTNSVTLTGLNTFTGSVEIQGGTLSVNSIANVGAGASALGNPATAAGGIIRMGLTTVATTLTYTGSGHSSDRIIAMQGTTGGVTLEADGTGALGLGEVHIETGGNKTLTLRGSSLPAIDNTLGAIDECDLGVLTLQKTDANTWLLTAVNTYSGPTNIDDGTLKIGVTDSLPTATAVRLGTGATAGTFDLNGSNQTIGSLTVQSTTNAVTNNLIVDSGNILTVNGAVTLGANADASSTAVTASGGGSIVVNSGGANFQVGGATGGTNDNKVTADFSGLSSFTANLGAGTFRVGDANTGTEDNASSFRLATNNMITAASVRIGDGSGGAFTHTLTLGSGTNTINADVINIGSAGATIRSGGSVVFDGADTTGTVTVRASDGASRATVNMVNTTGSTSGIMDSTFNLAGHTADLLVSTLTMAARTQNTGGANATLTFDQGTLDVTALVMASRTGAGTGGATATVNLGDSAAPGTPTVLIGSIDMAVNTSGGGAVSADLNVTGGSVTIGAGSGTAINMANAGAGHTVDSTVDLTGGTVTVTGNIVRTGGAGIENATITLDGASLNMSGNSIGASGATVTFAAQSGSLTNLAELNGGGLLTKSTAGTLSMGNGNTYTGGTTISGGTLLAVNTTGSATGSGAVTVNSSTTLGGTGAIMAASGNSITIDGTFSVGLTGDSSGQDMALAVSGGAGNLAFNGTALFDIFTNSQTGTLNPATANDRAIITADNWSNLLFGGTSTLKVVTTLDTSTWVAGDAWQIFDWFGIAGGTPPTSGFATVDLPALSGGLFWDTGALYTSGVISLSIVPEPSRALLLLLGLCGALMRRRKHHRQ